MANSSRNAGWCKFAEECPGSIPGDPAGAACLCERVIDEMKAVFGDDQRRIAHALKVLEYADAMLQSEEGQAAATEDGVVMESVQVLTEKK